MDRMREWVRAAALKGEVWPCGKWQQRGARAEVGFQGK